MSEIADPAPGYETIAATNVLRRVIGLYQRASESQDKAEIALKRSMEMVLRMEIELGERLDALAGQRLAVTIATRNGAMTAAHKEVITVERILPPIDNEESRAVIATSDANGGQCIAGFLGIYNYELYLWEDPSLLALDEPAE